MNKSKLTPLVVAVGISSLTVLLINTKNHKKSHADTADRSTHSTEVNSRFKGLSQSEASKQKTKNHNNTKFNSKTHSGTAASFHPNDTLATTKNDKATKDKKSNSMALNLNDIPEGILSNTLKTLSKKDLQIALTTLGTLGKIAVKNDYQSLRSDQDGGIFYTCSIGGTCSHNHHGSNNPDDPQERRLDDRAVLSKNSSTTANYTTAASEAVYETIYGGTFSATSSVSSKNVPVFHSRKGSKNIIFIDFNGGIVENTKWNSSKGVEKWDCYPFSLDSDRDHFSVEELNAIHEIWMRVAEDYSPFDVDVTTEDPGSLSKTTAWAMVTSKNDKLGNKCPHDMAGVAYVDTFGSWSNASYSPAWCSDSGNLASTAQTISHEVGHNMGLGHDGIPTSEYYWAHEAGRFRWNAIMGGGTSAQIVQWSNGSYYNASNKQDDLKVLNEKLTYLKDEQGATRATAMSLITPTSKTATRIARIERTNDIDMFKIECDTGVIEAKIDPFALVDPGSSFSSRLGGTLFVTVELQDTSGAVIASHTPDFGEIAEISKNLQAGTYYLVVKPRGFGKPLNNPPTGFTTYGTVGTYVVDVTLHDPGTFSPVVTTKLIPTKDAYYDWKGTHGSGVMKLSASADAFLKFDLSSIKGEISEMQLLLTVNQYSSTGTFTASQGDHSNWNESNLSRGTAPDAAKVLDTLNTTLSRGKIARFDVTEATRNGDEMTFIISSSSNYLVYLASRESDGDGAPLLIVKSKESISYDTTLSLKPGYQIISLDVVPEVTDMKELFKPVKSQIDFVQAQNGDKLYKHNNKLVNEIGDWKTDQAYIVKATAKAKLSIASSSNAVKEPALTTPGIHLIPTRKNMSQPALNYFAPILSKVEWIKDENGGYLRKVKSNWIDNISSLEEDSGLVVNIKK